jgi:hypothetical protein
MSSVEFDEPQIHYRTIDISGAVTHNTPLLVKTRIVKNLKQANITMGIIFFACLITTGFLIKYNFYSDTKKYKEDFTAQELKHMLPESVAKLQSKNIPNAQN